VKPRTRARKEVEGAKSGTSAPSIHLSTPRTLLLATGNPGKVEEIRHLLAGLDLEIRDLSQLDLATEIEEVGATFAQNAIIKARYCYEQSGLLTMADDSGLEVAALGGAPGVLSARYAGAGADDAQRVAKLLEALRGVHDHYRAARFVCVIALVGPDQLEQTFTGVCEGRIGHAPIGNSGFGYDPVFESPPLGKTFAQLSREEKSNVSHRGHAMQQLRQFLLEWIETRS
jgi:XTP/dITP diphosphohydrolase